MERDKLAGLFCSKITLEFEDYKRKLLKQEPDFIFEKAYQIDSIVSIYKILLEASRKMASEVLETLLIIPHLLVFFYRKWTRYEDLHAEELQECMDESIKGLQSAALLKGTWNDENRKPA